MTPTSPDVMPMLSRGKHRRPRQGACFMELASYLAGERWSDHPRCTHPLLATMARLVNDCTSDDGRQRLAGLIPSVIGVTSDDPRCEAVIALRAATIALPVAAGHRQQTLAVGVLASERVLIELDGTPPAALHAQSRAALEAAPEARTWASEFGAGMDVSVKGFRRSGARTIVLTAVVGIAQACIPDADDRLYELLAATITDCVALVRMAEPNPEPSLPAPAAQR
jgi:hypothetical protein